MSDYLGDYDAGLFDRDDTNTWPPPVDYFTTMPLTASRQSSGWLENIRNGAQPDAVPPVTVPPKPGDVVRLRHDDAPGDPYAYLVFTGDYDDRELYDAAALGWPTWPHAYYGRYFRHLTPAYTPGWFYVTGAGVVDGNPAPVGSRLYVTAVGRTYGELRYGDDVYGGDPPAPPWPVSEPARIRWLPRSWSDAPAWDRPPAPSGGIELRDGWRIVIEAYRPVAGARLYGSLGYGDGVYGDTLPVSSDWHDITCPVVAFELTRGAGDGSPFVDVDIATLDLVDVDASLAPIVPRTATADELVRTVTRSTPLRVSLIAPNGDPHPLFTGRVRDVYDDHDRPPRVVTITAYGMTSDLAEPVTVDRDSEPVADRVAAILDIAGYRWGSDLTNPQTVGNLRRTDPQTLPARQLVDIAALSAGTVAVADRFGVIGLRPWPYPTTPAPTVKVVDNVDRDGLAGNRISLASDDRELLNDLTLTSAPVQGASAIERRHVNGSSVGRFGPSSQALGLPVSELSATADDLDALVAAIVDRYGEVVHRCELVDVDVDTDSRWLPALATLDLGDVVAVDITRPFRVTWRTVVVGFSIRIAASPTGRAPHRVAGTLNLSTVDRTI